jgi:hypothetical protein
MGGLIMLGVVLGLGRLRLRSPGAANSSLLLFGCLLFGCTDDGTRLGGTRISGQVGAYEPTDRRDTGVEAGPVGKCMWDSIDGDADGGAAPKSSEPRTHGTLTVSFTTTPPANAPPGAGTYDLKNGETSPNYGAVWVQDPMGRYVKTIELWGKKFLLSGLTFYITKRVNCPADDVDTVSRATPPDHQLHRLTWDLESQNNSVIPDGMYELWLYTQIDENVAHSNPPVIVPFAKGGTAWTQTIAPAPPLTGLTMTYTPSK